MFRENNEAFLMSFEEKSLIQSSSDSYKDLPILQKPIPTPNLTKPKLLTYEENDHFSWGRSSKKEETQIKKQSEQCPQKNELGPSRRINHLKASQALSRTRKFSSVGADLQLTKLLELKNEIAKSQKSFNLDDDMQNEENADHPHHEERDEMTNEKNNQQMDPTMIFMKKIRNLQTRIKNLCLKHETGQLKLKEQHEKNKQILGIYENHIQKQHPEIFTVIDQKIKQAEENHFGINCFSDSSSENMHKSRDLQTMPVYSQLEEVRLEGKKVCERLKSLEVTVKELQKQIFTTKRASEENRSLSNASKMLRKWSIPYNYNREKKQSFQTTINSADEKKERFSRNSSTQGIENQHQQNFKKFPLLGIDTPVIREYEIPQIPNNSPVKFISERFIHVQNYEMDYDEEEGKKEEKIKEEMKKSIKEELKEQCQKCVQMKNFILKVNSKLKKLPNLNRNGSLQSLF